jgi:hypothetical protein
MPVLSGPCHPDSGLARRILDDFSAWLAGGEGFGVTSSVTGDGAVQVVENMFSALHENRPALLTPSATYAMRGALAAAGVRAGDSVVIPRYDWPSTLAAVKSLGAKPVFADADETTLTINANILKNTDMHKVKAVVVCHIYGTVADMPAIREAAGGIPLIEDCAQAAGSALDGRAAGTFGDMAVYSFGPGKTLYAGEGGMVITKDWDLHEKLLRETAHPARQSIGGAGEDIRFDNFSIRPHPAAAIMLFSALKVFDPEKRRGESKALALEIGADKNLQVIGMDKRRQNAAGKVAVMPDRPGEIPETRYNFVPGRAFDLKKRKPAELPVYIVSRPE